MVMHVHAWLQGRTCVVIGGAGFVGGHLVAALEEVGASVVVFDIRRPARLGPRSTAVVGDLCSFEARTRPPTHPLLLK
jgi:nucleoside-diphosphate-sugar epimerase